MVALGNSVVTLQVQGSVKDSVLRRSVQGLQISPPFGEQSTKRATSIQGNGPCFRTARGSDLRVMSAIQVTPVPAADKVGGDLPEGYEFDDPTKKLLPRRAGILLHPTSLPGPYGVGELGAEAFKFIDWLDSTGCSVWQVLPLVPPGRKSGEDGSPYSGQDANCGNTLLISLDALVEEGLLKKEELPSPIAVSRVDYEEVARVKDPLIVKAASRVLSSSGPLKAELDKFRKDSHIAGWLEEAALFAAIDSSIDAEFWWQWPVEVRDRQPQAMEKARVEHKDFIANFVAQQFLFQWQWQAVHSYASSKAIRIIGDMPIYVGGHSADVWANRSEFMLDPETGVPALVSGVPPDLFSATGQLWGSPLYNWEAMASNGYSWWVQRMSRAFALYDEFRIDHFRGLAGYWSIPAAAETAMEGTWKMGPREGFFEAINDKIGKVDIIAEDLGVITSDVVDLRNAIEAPGMAVLQFAFGSDPRNPHLPHNHETNQVVYPGTHDNDTVVGWWEKIPAAEKENALKYLRASAEDAIHWELIRCGSASVARTMIVALQDVLGLDNSARMNTPAVQKGNWGWRVGETGFFDTLEKEVEILKTIITDHNRLPKHKRVKVEEVVIETDALSLLLDSGISIIEKPLSANEVVAK